MKIIPWAGHAEESSNPASGTGVYTAKPRRPANREDVVDAVVVSEDREPRSLRLAVRLPEDINIRAIVGTAVAVLALGFVLLVMAAVGALVAIEMFVLMVTEPL